ncbi:MAG: hypothetical protein LUG52_10660, partial [Clostridia bacterium]|nr:hypothetical protein [Clostridia bacterium]
TYKGSDDEIEFGNALYGSDLIVLHNHPRNSSYSTTDMQFVLSNRSVKTITIVKNNGAVETLTKTENFDEQKAITELKRAYKSFVKTQNDTEISKAISKFIEQYKEGLSWEKQ